jgi:DNA repair protein RecN (Recombination protein N)
LSSLAQVKQALQGLVRFGKQYESFSERFNSAYIELKELSAELGDSGADVSFDQARLSEINGSLDRLNRLLKKHGVPDEEGLMAAKADVEEKLLKFGSVESQIQESRREHARLLKACTAMAENLSSQRAKSLPGIEKQVKASLSILGMEHAQFRIRMERSAEPGPAGFDDVSFLFTANKGGTPAELQKVASGGELSRLMLTLKALLAEKKKLPCIVFDEIDTGVSGEVADKIGTILQKMGSRMQVIAITHLPQLASKGRHHLFVYKEEQGTGTISLIRDLSEEERVNEIAKILSRGKPTATALSNARELLDQ